MPGLRAQHLYTQIYVDAGFQIARTIIRIAERAISRRYDVAGYNRNFDLTINDVDLIESSLRQSGRDLSARLLAFSEENPAHLVSIRSIQAELNTVENLLGRLHNQKIFYRPKKQVYVSG